MIEISASAPSRPFHASSPGLKVALRTVAAIDLAWAAIPAYASGFTFQNIVNNNDVTFNQELGINSSGTIAGYFGSGAAGHPNQGYTVVPPYGQPNFSNENVPASVQTQVTGINNIGTTVGFWSDQNNANLVNNNFGFFDIANVLLQSTIRPLERGLRLTNCSASTIAISLSAFTSTLRASRTDILSI